jgi:hypothetical protein
MRFKKNLRLRWWFLLAAALVAIVAGVLAFVRGPGTSAKIGELAFSPEDADLGTVPFDVKAPFRFQMQNVGTGAVSIKKTSIKTVEGC